MQQASLHLDTNEQPSDLQGDNGTTAAELPPPRDNNSGEDKSSSLHNEESLFLSSVIDLISVQQEEIGDMAMEVECESVQQNQVPTEHHTIPFALGVWMLGQHLTLETVMESFVVWALEQVRHHATTMDAMQ